MKRAKRRAIWLLGALAGLTFVLALGGCALQRIMPEDLIAQGYSCIVTFDLQGGSANGRTYYEQYVQPNSLVLRPGEKDADPVPTREGFTLNGYWLGEENADGTVSFTREWDFETDRVTESITLYACWFNDYSLVVHHGENYEETTSVSVPQSSDGTAQAVESLRITGYTLLENCVYPTQKDAEEGTNAIAFPYTPEGLKQADESGPAILEVEVWANTLEGVWTLVDEADDISRIGTATNLYFLPGENGEPATIDMGGKELSFPSNYSGKIEGNGVTLKNFKVEKAQASGTGTFSYGMFDSLGAGASIRNITFADVAFTAMLTNPIVQEYRVGLLAGTVNKGAVVEGVTLSGSFTFVVADSIFESVLADGTADAFGYFLGYGEEDEHPTANVEGVKQTKVRQSEYTAEDPQNS